jgi:hypothetical protein
MNGQRLTYFSDAMSWFRSRMAFLSQCYAPSLRVSQSLRRPSESRKLSETSRQSSSYDMAISRDYKLHYVSSLSRRSEIPLIVSSPKKILQITIAIPIYGVKMFCPVRMDARGAR